MKLYASTRPDLSMVYSHASLTVLGWPVHIMFSPVSWDLPGSNKAGVGIIGRLADEWRWQDVDRAGKLGIDLYRFTYSMPVREERRAWATAGEVAHAAV